jgi:hypothetical protein
MIRALRAGTGVGVGVGSGIGVAVADADVGVGGTTTVGRSATVVGLAPAGTTAAGWLVGGCTACPDAARVGFGCATAVGRGLTNGDTTDQTIRPPSTINIATTTGVAMINACRAGDWS